MQHINPNPFTPMPQNGLADARAISSSFQWAFDQKWAAVQEGVDSGSLKDAEWIAEVWKIADLVETGAVENAMTVEFRIAPAKLWLWENAEAGNRKLFQELQREVESYCPYVHSSEYAVAALGRIEERINKELARRFKEGMVERSGHRYAGG